MTTNDDAEPQRLFNCNILGSIGRAIAAFPGQLFHALREHL